MIRTESGLIALEEGTVVVDSAGSEWVREDLERQWQGMDVPYPVLVDTEDNWVEFLDDNLYMPSTVALDYGPFKVKMTDHTPTTEEVREQYTREEPPRIGTFSARVTEFDRWLADFKRKIAAEAWDAAVRSMRYEDGTPVELVSVVNPYRADRVEQEDDK